jgi:hypothetical protein
MLVTNYSKLDLIIWHLPIQRQSTFKEVLHIAPVNLLAEIKHNKQKKIMKIIHPVAVLWGSANDATRSGAGKFAVRREPLTGWRTGRGVAG